MKTSALRRRPRTQQRWITLAEGDAGGLHAVSIAGQCQMVGFSITSARYLYEINLTPEDARHVASWLMKQAGPRRGRK